MFPVRVSVMTVEKKIGVAMDASLTNSPLLQISSSVVAVIKEQ